MIMDLSGDSTAKNKIAPYRAIFANATDGIAIIDRDAKYIEQNLAHRAILGYSDEE
jgi:PAS domain S-box-containing protein